MANNSITRTFCQIDDNVPQSRDRGLEEWLVGEAFAFRHEDTDPVRFLGRDGGANLGSPEASVAIAPRPLNLPRVEAVFTDKDLYREGDDTVRVVVFRPSLSRVIGARGSGPYRGSADSEIAPSRATITILQAGHELTTVDVDLDRVGMGLYELPDPVAGEYEIRLGEGDASTRFTVAGYKLAPLTARLERSEVRGPDDDLELRYTLALETYGAPLTGPLTVSLDDLSQSPPRTLGRRRLEAVDGRCMGTARLCGEGPFALTIQSVDDAMKTATVPLPGSGKSERESTELSRWGKRAFARLMHFEGASVNRGLHHAEEEDPRSTAPLELVEVRDGRAIVRFRSDVSAWRFAIIDPSDEHHHELGGGAARAGETVAFPVEDLTSPWAFLLAGVITLGTAWEGRAALLLPEEGPALEIAAPDRGEPGDLVTIELDGAPRASVFLLVKDARLQVADTPLAATAASLRRQIVGGLGLFADGQVTTTLEMLLTPPPQPRFAMPVPSAPAGFALEAPRRRAVGVFGVLSRASAAPVDMPAMLMEEDCCDDELAVDCCESAAGSVRTETLEAGDTPAVAKPKRDELLEVLLARIVHLDTKGHAEVECTLGDAMGTMSVEAFAASGSEWSAATETLEVTREVFGELVVPRFVRNGDYAEGALFVHAESGTAEVTLRRDGTPVSLFTDGESEATTTAFVSAPGATLRFVAEPGTYEAMVRGEAIIDQSEAKVEEPGKVVWLQRAVRLLKPGDVVDLDAEPGGVSLEVLPSLDGVFDDMVGGLRGYEHCCCEQTSAVMLAAAAAYLTAPDAETKRDAGNHIRACVEREKRMYLPGRGFKGWPEYPDEVFMFSPGATLNLLQMDMLRGEQLDADLAKSIDECLAMAKDAAKAHGLDMAPAKPKSAREAYGRFSQFIDDRQRMARFIRERIEPWEREMEAILKFKLPSVQTETYHRSPAMVRAETAFGAATLIEMGGEHLLAGLELANTVLDAVGESGSLYSTLDSVAAITLLTALRRAKLNCNAESPCRINGELTSIGEATDGSRSIRQLESIDAPLQVRVTRLVEEDYTALDSGVDCRVWLERRGRKVKGSVTVGDQLDLVLDIKSGYEAGDLVHVFLPDALSWLHGGGQVKRFSLDLEGQTRFRVPLAATGLTLDGQGAAAPQRFALCLRNMYDEERGKGFDDLAVTVERPAAQGAGGLARKVLSSLKALVV